jgi:hypothetical protein
LLERRKCLAAVAAEEEAEEELPEKQRAPAKVMEPPLEMVRAWPWGLVLAKEKVGATDLGLAPVTDLANDGEVIQRAMRGSDCSASLGTARPPLLEPLGCSRRGNSAG